ncbi:TetR/AcrR family transcriptional regulator [Nonomuraea pusilla]|uniref:Transcriptional regulator, TetR family n=1 Tax=Nonomuraea pusilla TaxID=46177 RepID=A0A1H7N4S1_9ACTN|nr:TetR/AcrR family transcriptional regulator [Nonomuraea pusilla]SEL18321.1 transcriptional regulator, TetR family [Nonomuraea pusilla]
MMAGLRERKKAETRRRIAETALRLFDARGYDAVTVNEIAEAAGVAKVTLFSYFPSKEAIVLDGVGDDLAGVVERRGAGRTPLAALRAHLREVAARPPGEADAGELAGELMARVRVITSSPALLAAVEQANAAERHRLAAALAAARGAGGGADGGAALGAGGDDLVARLMAAQVTAVVGALQEAFFLRLASGTPMEEAGRRLTADVETAFDLLEHGLAAADEHATQQNGDSHEDGR